MKTENELVTMAEQERDVYDKFALRNAAKDEAARLMPSPSGASRSGMASQFDGASSSEARPSCVEGSRRGDRT